MARAGHSARPVVRLGEEVQALEAAVGVCLAKPRKEAVHGLRTATRRIEAQLVLLSLLPGLPAHNAEAGKVRRLLKRLRRAAGAVRDIDVQRELVKEEAAMRGRGIGEDRAVRKEARALRGTLQKSREREAERLLRLLRKGKKKLPPAFEELLYSLGPGDAVSLTERRLVGLVREWFGRPGEVAADGAAQGTPRLHEMRKRAKVARYLAESAGEGAREARRMAGRFEGLQKAGGEWHDWLLLAEVAEKELGAGAELVRRVRARTEAALRRFEQRLRYRI